MISACLILVFQYLYLDADFYLAYFWEEITHVTDILIHIYAHITTHTYMQIYTYVDIYERSLFTRHVEIGELSAHPYASKYSYIKVTMYPYIAYIHILHTGTQIC